MSNIVSMLLGVFFIVYIISFFGAMIEGLCLRELPKEYDYRDIDNMIVDRILQGVNTFSGLEVSLFSYLNRFTNEPIGGWKVLKDRISHLEKKGRIYRRMTTPETYGMGSGNDGAF